MDEQKLVIIKKELSTAMHYKGHKISNGFVIGLTICHAGGVKKRRGSAMYTDRRGILEVEISSLKALIRVGLVTKNYELTSEGYNMFYQVAYRADEVNTRRKVNAW